VTPAFGYAESSAYAAAHNDASQWMDCAGRQ